MTTKRIALLIVAAHLALGVAFSATVPLWEAYDEWGHYPYIRYIAIHRALPPRGKEIVIENDTAHIQPPLYYVLGAIATAWVDTHDWHEPLRNRYSSLPTAMGGYNRALHGYEEDFPWHGTVLAVHIARLVSVVLSTITVWLTFCIGRTLVPRRPEVALGAMAINAFWPQFLFIGSVINNDNLVTTFAALLLWLVVRNIIYPGQWRDRLFLIASLVGVIASKVTGLAFVPVGLLGLVLSFQLASKRQRWVIIGLTLAAATLVGAFFVVQHPQYVERLDFFLNPAGLREMSLDRFGNVLQLMWGTLWASFGWQSVSMAEWTYLVIQPVWLLALVGLVWAFVRIPQPEMRWAIVALVLPVLCVGGATLYRGLFSAYYFTGRYLLSTIAGFSTLLAIGLSHLGPRRVTRGILVAVSMGMFALAIYTPGAFIAPVYARPAKLPPQALENLPHPLYVRFDDKIELAGYDVEPTAFRPGDTVKVTLYWHCLRQMDVNYTLAIKLLGQKGAEIAGLNVHPGRGNYPTSLWQVGDIFKDEYLLPVAADAVAPCMVQVKIAFFRDIDPTPGQVDAPPPTPPPDLFRHLPAFSADSSPLGEAAIFGRLKLATPTPPHYSPQNVVDFHFGDAIRLIGYDVDAPVELGQPLPLTLYWRAEHTVDRPYTVFVHALDDTGQRTFGVDAEPLDGHYPTDLWSRGETIADTHIVPLPRGLSTEMIHLAIGMYSLESGERLPVTDTTGRPVPNGQITLDLISVPEK